MLTTLEKNIAKDFASKLANHKGIVFEHSIYCQTYQLCKAGIESKTILNICEERFDRLTKHRFEEIIRATKIPAAKIQQFCDYVWLQFQDMI